MEKELRSFSYGSAYYDADLVKVAEAVVKGAATNEDVQALRDTVTWRRNKQSEIHALADKLVKKNIVPHSVFSLPIQLLPISTVSYKNRKLLIELVPELSAYIVPPEGDNLQFMYFAPLYWLAILLARARETSPNTCSLERVVMALVDLGVAKVPEGKTKEGYVSSLTRGRELEAETLFLGMDDITQPLCRAKPFFGWSLAPYDKEFVIEEKKEEPVWKQVNDVDGFIEEEEGQEEEEQEEEEAEEKEGAKKSRSWFKDYWLVIFCIICAWGWTGIGLLDLPHWSGYEGTVGKPVWAFLADKALDY